jgi:hypothetical protein
MPKPKAKLVDQHPIARTPMQKRPLDPDVADTAPSDSALTAYDEELPFEREFSLTNSLRLGLQPTPFSRYNPWGSTSSAILNIRLRNARIALAICFVRVAGTSDGNGARKTACLDRRRDQALDRTRAAEDECAFDREAAWTPHSFCQTTRLPIGIDSARGRTSSQA